MSRPAADYRALLREGAEALSSVSDTPRLDAELLLAHVTGRERVWFAVHAGERPDGAETAAFRALVARRAQSEPVAYLVGAREFMGLPFSVGPGVLIPRPDTETLAEAVLAEELPAAPRILDLCTGSGALAVSLAHFLPSARVTAVDVSETCAQTARKNAEQNGVSERCRVVCADLFSDALPQTALPDGGRADALVSNPPYIRRDELGSLMPDVRDYEPRLALDGGADGLIFYRRIAALLPSLLAPGGLLALEVGCGQAEAVRDIFSDRCGGFRFVCDLAGTRRVALARRRG